MPHRRRPHLIACALGALLAASLLVPAPAEAARKGKKAGPATVADAPRKAQRSKKMVFNGSAETTAACAANAGAAPTREPAWATRTDGPRGAPFAHLLIANNTIPTPTIGIFYLKFSLPRRPRQRRPSGGRQSEGEGRRRLAPALLFL